MPSSETYRAVEKLNQMLGAELGSPCGPAAFAWKWSEDLMTLVQDTDPMTGKPAMVAVCICGVDAAIHLPECRMTTMKVKTKRILIAPNLFNRWVFCRWMEPPSEEKWKAVFNSMEDYPRNGTYAPMASNNNTLALKPETIPTEPLTRLMINTVKSARPILEIIAETAERQAKEEELAQITRKGDVISRPAKGTKWWEHHERIRDKMSTYGQIPGSKGAVSYPSVQKAKKERLN